MTNADLLYSDVEEDLRASVRDLLADSSDPATVLARCETAEPYDLRLWRTLGAELGAAGLHVPEHLGGQGASTRETAIVLEELGRAVAPVPFLGSAVLATSTLLGCDTSLPEVAEPLAVLAAGRSTAALAVPLSTPPAAPFPAAVRVDGEGRLSGRVSTVADAPVAELLVVPAVGPDGPELRTVEVPSTGATVKPLVALDLTRGIADVTFDGAASRRLAVGDRAADALRNALTTGAGLLASEQLGVAQWCLDTTVRYVGERHQFGRPVGSFQALKHRLADLWLDLVAARAAARYAADALATSSTDAPVAVAVAASHCSSVAVRAAEECIQLHGGIGMTWEHPAHLFLKRAKSNEIALGTPGRHRVALAELVDLPAPLA